MGDGGWTGSPGLTFPDSTNQSCFSLGSSPGMRKVALIVAVVVLLAVDVLVVVVVVLLLHCAVSVPLPFVTRQGLGG